MSLSVVSSSQDPELGGVTDPPTPFLAYKPYYDQLTALVAAFSQTGGSNQRRCRAGTGPERHQVGVAEGHQKEVVRAKVDRTIPGDRENLTRSPAGRQR